MQYSILHTSTYIYITIKDFFPEEKENIKIIQQLKQKSTQKLSPLRYGYLMDSYQLCLSNQLHTKLLANLNLQECTCSYPH